jgi:hypothetical protein
VAPGDWILAGGGPVIWCYSADGRIVRVDTKAAQVTARFQLPASKPGLVGVHSVRSTLWVDRADGLWHVGDAGAPAPAALPDGATIAALATDPQWLWATTTDGRLLRVDPLAGSVTVVGQNPALAHLVALASGPDALYVAGASALTVLDPKTAATVRSRPLPTDNGVSLSVSAQAVWAIADHTAIPVGNGGTATGTPVSLAGSEWTTPPESGFGALWIGDVLNQKLLSIPLAGGSAVERIDLPYPPDFEGADLVLKLLIGSDSVWIVDFDGPTGVLRMQPQRNHRATRVVQPETQLTLAAVLADPPHA